MEKEMDLLKFKEEIKVDEGQKLNDNGEHILYLDHKGFKTLGYGTLVTEWDEEYDQEVGTVVSQERVDECFEKFVNICVKDCRSIYPNYDDLPEEAQRILANMSYNLGYHRLKNFKKLRESIINNDFSSAAVEMEDSKWCREDVPNRANRLIERMKSLI